MDTVSTFIERLGGTSAVAAALALTPSTVSSWKSSERVPLWRRPALLAFATDRKMSVDNVLFDGARHSNAKAA